MAEVKVIASPSSWIEGEAVAQLERTARLPDMIRAVGLPDLHPGRGCPVGAAFVTDGRIYPHLIGTDIGCGMGLWTTSVKRPRPDKLEKKLKGLEGPIDSPEDRLGRYGIDPCGHEHSLGTIGRGNHFAELLVIDEVIHQKGLDEAVPGHEPDHALLLVHSGSRGYGEKILYEHTARFRDEGLEAYTDAFNEYFDQHDNAVRWAYLNRELIAERILDRLGATGERVLDIAHNFVEVHMNDFGSDVLFVHRKGAIPSNHGPVVIPGSRGAHSYLVEPTHDLLAHTEAGWSLSHGAGRKMSRKDAVQKAYGRVPLFRGGVSLESLKRTKLGSVVICEDSMILKEEIPEAYKPIARVIQDLVDHGLVKVLATLKPVLTYKMRQHDHDK
jgi:release factor H-coupled RctB family protein